MAEGDKKLLRILCIHGYRQNASTFRERTGAFRKIIKKHAELVFIDAPNVVPPMESEAAEANTAEQLGWWFSRRDSYFHAQEESDCDEGLEESFKVIETAFKEQGPFDGVLGFSQGAAVVAMMCSMLQQDKEECPFQFKFAIMVAGFRSRTKQHAKHYAHHVTMPTLHVFGDTDKVIEKEMSEDLLQYFDGATVLQHPGGHFIPASGPQKKIYVDFLTKMLAPKS